MIKHIGDKMVKLKLRDNITQNSDDGVLRRWLRKSICLKGQNTRMKSTINWIRKGDEIIMDK